MSQDIHQGLNDLISYYQGLSNYNHKFPNLNTVNYDTLIEQLLAIRQLLINKLTTNINAIYKPTEKLFAIRDHFKILETIVQFYKQNGDIAYPTPEIETSEERYALINTGLSDNTITELQQSLAEIKNYIATNTSAGSSNQAYDNIHSQLSGIKESINGLMGGDVSQNVIKSNNALLTVIKTNHELTKADLSRYDSLLTEHINKSNMNIAEAIDKEHARFVHKMSSDVNAIVAEITKANVAELATQRELIQTDMTNIEGNSLKWFFFSFIAGVFLLFACSGFSSIWAANRAISYARIFKITTVCAPDKPVINSHKIKHQVHDNDE